MVALALTVACTPPVNEIRVEPGTASFKPVFVLTDTTGHAPSGVIYGVSVVPCGADTAVWQIAASGSNRAPMRLEYGQTPPGYVAHIGPQVLRPGCYNVYVTDGRRAQFRIDARGRMSGDAVRDTTSR
jgi:urocanate hydratase